MNILIVGNVIKDIYLNLDNRTENLETDKQDIKWLNLSFDASSHYYYNRHSSFSGSAISLQVLSRLGIDAAINNSAFDLQTPGNAFLTKSYRYILVSDDNVAYFVPSKPEPTTFTAPTDHVDYLYIDRSAQIDQPTIDQVIKYLEDHPATKLILHLKDYRNPHLVSLAIHHATLIFAEKHIESLDPEKTIYLTEHDFTYKDITEKATISRIDKFTHLSAYLVTATTILGSFILGYSIEDSLKMARINIENSNLDSTLTLDELKSLLNLPESSLELIAANLMAKGKGILAADESGGSIKKKFAELDITDAFENRHNYRNLFFTTPDIENYLNGIILFDETARDYTDTGQTVVDYLISHRIIPGIKVDQGLEKFEDSEETYTKGLENLSERLREYYIMGLRFAKWRAAFEIKLSESGEILTPTKRAIEENCRILAEYAHKCQRAGLVPIVEPEVVYNGDYNIDKSAEITSKVLDYLFSELENHCVNLHACILKVNMVLAGKQSKVQSTPEEVGQKTAAVLKNHIPEELAGVVFLSGGQTPEQATANLAAIIKNGPFPWPVTFSFARALQDPALYAWSGNNANSEKARQALLDRLIANTDIL